MKKTITALLLFCGSLQAFDMDLARAIYNQEWAKAQFMVNVFLERGTDEQKLDAAIGGIHIAEQIGEDCFLPLYQWMLHRLLAPTLGGDFNDTEQR